MGTCKSACNWVKPKHRRPDKKPKNEQFVLRKGSFKRARRQLVAKSCVTFNRCPQTAKKGGEMGTGFNYIKQILLKNILIR